MRSTNSGSKPELTKKVDDQHHGTNKAGLEWFCQLEPNPVTLNLFIYHHGTGPRAVKETGVMSQDNFNYETCPDGSVTVFVLL